MASRAPLTLIFLMPLLCAAETMLSLARNHSCVGDSTCSSTVRSLKLQDDVSLLQVHSSILSRRLAEGLQKGKARKHDRAGHLHLTSMRREGASKKSFVYFRHGESYGNAGTKANKIGGLSMKARAASYALQAADGKLTPWSAGESPFGTAGGEQQAKDRINSLLVSPSDEDHAIVKNIVDAQLVLVSPLSRAMATALIVISEVMRNCVALVAEHGQPAGRTVCAQTAEGPWPAVKVDVLLREKVCSVSEHPGCGRHDPEEYLDEILAKCEDGLDDVKTAGLRLITKAMKDSYKKARPEAPTKAECKNPQIWQPFPDNAYVMQDMITQFKERVVNYRVNNMEVVVDGGEPVETVLLVAHSGWARYAFAPYLPGAEEANVEENLRLGGRWIFPLNNAGVVTGEITEGGHFNEIHIEQEGPDQQFPNTLQKKEFATFNDDLEAKQAGAIPEQSCLKRFLVEQKVGTSWKQRLIFLSSIPASSPETVLSFSFDQWGKPEGTMHIAEMRIHDMAAKGKQGAYSILVVNRNGADKTGFRMPQKGKPPFVVAKDYVEGIKSEIEQFLDGKCQVVQEQGEEVEQVEEMGQKEQQEGEVAMKEEDRMDQNDPAEQTMNPMSRL